MAVFGLDGVPGQCLTRLAHGWPAFRRKWQHSGDLAIVGSADRVRHGPKVLTRSATVPGGSGLSPWPRGDRNLPATPRRRADSCAPVTVVASRLRSVTGVARRGSPWAWSLRNVCGRRCLDKGQTSLYKRGFRHCFRWLPGPQPGGEFTDGVMRKHHQRSAGVRPALAGPPNPQRRKSLLLTVPLSVHEEMIHAQELRGEAAHDHEHV